MIFFVLRTFLRVVIIFFPFESSRYLKEFRVEQCPLFLQHKCTAHRPFTCFHWHFMNQRRRRPKKKRDGTFNYSPDVYCTQYDETSGICPSGDEYVPRIFACICLVYLRTGGLILFIFGTGDELLTQSPFLFQLSLFTPRSWRCGTSIPSSLL